MKRSKDKASNGRGSQLETPAASSPSEGSDSEETQTVGGIGSNRELTLTDASQYLAEVRYKFREEKEKYDELVQALNEWRAERNAAGLILIARVQEILKGHTDLLSGFDIFVHNGRQIPISPVEMKLFEKPDPHLTKVKKDRTTTLHADHGLIMERPKSDKDIGIVKEETEQRWLDEEENVNREDIDRRDREEDDRDLVISEIMENEGQLPRSVKMYRDRNQVLEEDDWVKRDKLDLSKCEQCTPSYRFLPKDYPRPIASQRSKLEDEVLNDDLVNVAPESEDYSFKHMPKNLHAEVLFKCEDDRFEADVLIEYGKATIKQMEELIAKMNDNRNKMDSPIRIKEHFTAQSLRCIESIYGEHGLDVIELLTNEPQLATTVILTRLKQKQEEWTSRRSDWNKVWAEVYAENHDKSLNHRSSFRKKRSKNLRRKGIFPSTKKQDEQR